jgi:mannose-6-phosphate isomerase
MRDIRPWRKQLPTDIRTGEISYERNTETSAPPALCLKLLLADQPLSIQVHPDDTYAMTIGLPSGKNEAWYVVRAAPGAQIGVGLTQHLSRAQLRLAIADGSIADLLLWRTVAPGDSCLIPAGTVHAIGAGLVIAEIQNRVDATFRLYDYGRGRELHIDQGMAVALAEPAAGLFEQCRLSDTRRLLAVSAEFIFERLDLPPRSTWLLDATPETWLLILSGRGTIGALALATGEAVFAQQDKITLRIHENGLTALIAYHGSGPNSSLLQKADGDIVEQDPDAQVLTGLTSAMTTFTRPRDRSHS